jgi:hypothetical protein
MEPTPEDSPLGGAVRKQTNEEETRYRADADSCHTSGLPAELGTASFTANALWDRLYRGQRMIRTMNRCARYSKPAMGLAAFLAVACVAGRNGGISATVLSPTAHSARQTGQGLGPAPVNLRTAGNYVILAETGITNVPGSAITGNLGVSPIAASAITGFGLIYPAGSPFSLSAQVVGKVYAADYGSPTPANLTQAVGDMETAYLDASGRLSPDYTELAVGDIGGLTLRPGLYKWSSTVTIPKDVTLNGGPNDVWIFQISGDVTESSAAKVILTGGALAKNVFWQVAGVVALGTTAHMEGVVLSKTAITLNTGASANGRLMAQTNVTLIMNTVVEPAP